MAMHDKKSYCIFFKITPNSLVLLSDVYEVWTVNVLYYVLVALQI